MKFIGHEDGIYVDVNQGLRRIINSARIPALCFLLMDSEYVSMARTNRYTRQLPTRERTAEQKIWKLNQHHPKKMRNKLDADGEWQHVRLDISQMNVLFRTSDGMFATTPLQRCHLGSWTIAMIRVEQRELSIAWAAADLKLFPADGMDLFCGNFITSSKARVSRGNFLRCSSSDVLTANGNRRDFGLVVGKIWRGWKLRRK